MSSPTDGPTPIQASSMQQYPWLRHAFSTRSGGVSTCYGGASLNLGRTKEDDPDHVRENRRRFLEAAVRKEEGEHFTLVVPRQTHSAHIHEVRSCSEVEAGFETPGGKPVLEADGLISDLPGLLLAISTADCVPVLVADTSRRVVAAFHAGWRGTVARIVEYGIARLEHNYSSRPEDLIAVIGPSIGPCCYSVGEEVHAAFSSGFGYAERLFYQVDTPEPWRRRPEGDTLGSPVPRLHLDLWEANRSQLLRAGLRDTQITVLGACTACSRDPQGNLTYFSHRGEYGVAGRSLSAIGIARPIGNTQL